MHPKPRENALLLNILPTLFLAVVLSKLSSITLQCVADRHFRQNRQRLAAAPPIIHERRLPRHRRPSLSPALPAWRVHSTPPLNARPWLNML